MVNHNPYFEEQTTQWPKEEVQKDKQRPTKHTHKTNDRVTRTLLRFEKISVLCCGFNSVHLTVLCAMVSIVCLWMFLGL